MNIPEADAVDQEEPVAPAIDDALVRLEPEDGGVDRDRRDHDRGEGRRVDDAGESVPFGHGRHSRHVVGGRSAGSLPTLRWMSDPAAEAPGTLERLARRPLEHLGGVVRGVARALPRAVEDMFTDRCTQYAAAIAYRVLFSLFPLTIALVSIFGLVLQDDELRQYVIDELIAFLPVSESGQSERPAVDRGDRDPALGNRPHLARRAALGRVRDDGVDPPRARGCPEGRSRTPGRSREARRLRPRRGRGRPRAR